MQQLVDVEPQAPGEDMGIVTDAVVQEHVLTQRVVDPLQENDPWNNPQRTEQQRQQQPQQQPRLQLQSPTPGVSDIFHDTDIRCDSK